MLINLIRILVKHFSQKKNYYNFSKIKYQQLIYCLYRDKDSWIFAKTYLSIWHTKNYSGHYYVMSVFGT
jgi:hypothetical protein